MKIGFRRYRDADAPAVARLNERLARAGLSEVVGGEPPGADEPSLDRTPIIERMYVAAEGDEIRGAVWLKEQMFRVAGERVRAGWAVYPVSESLDDKRYAGVPATMIFGLLRLQPRLMALGMGGHAGPFARLLAGAKWASSIVPLQFRIRNASRVLRELSALRRRPWTRGGASLLAWSGLGWAGNRVAEALLRTRPRRDLAAWVNGDFGPWADAVWERCRDAYGFCAERDARSLESLYPRDYGPLTRVRVGAEDGRDVGWACVQAYEAEGTWLEEQFGRLRVGILLDGFGAPDDAHAIVAAGVEQLEREGVDLIITNQAHPAWQAAARADGFWNGPSNLAFYRSPGAEKLLARSTGAAHLTRADGDGPERPLPTPP